MYTKSNRKSGSTKSLAWFPPYFCFMFWLERLPSTIFRRFSTFRHRLARVVSPVMLTVPSSGTLRVVVKPPRLRPRRVSNTTPCSRMYTRLYSRYLPSYIFENFSSYKTPIFVKLCMHAARGRDAYQHMSKLRLFASQILRGKG